MLAWDDWAPFTAFAQRARDDDACTGHRVGAILYSRGECTGHRVATIP